MSKATEPFVLIAEERIVGPHDVAIEIRYSCKVSKATKLEKIVPDKAIYDFIYEYLKLAQQARK